MDDNWIVENLENALATWNEKLAEIWQLVSMTPQEFKGGGIWNIVVQINGALQAIGYGLLVLFFAMGLFKNTVNFQELRRPEAALRYFLHFVAAKAAVTYCMPLMLAVFDICGGIVSTVAGQMGGMAGNVGTLPGEISAAIGNVGFLASIPLWLVTILGSLFITVLSFILIMTVYRKNLFKKGWLVSLADYTYLIILAVIAAFPLIWIILSSLKSKGELIGNPTAFWPQQFTLDYYRTVLGQLNFGHNVLNSLVVAGCTMVLAITISALGAYGILRFFPRFGKAITRVLISTYMFPPILLSIPYTILMGKLGLTNSRIGLIIMYLSFSVPYAVWLLIGFFKTVPLGIEEAACIDGANKLQVFVKVVLPNVAPGVVAVAIYTFINAWNEFLYALLILNSRELMTVSVALNSLEGQEVLDWGVMMTASAIVVIPAVVFFMLIQKKIAGGLTEGSVK